MQRILAALVISYVLVIAATSVSGLLADDPQSFGVHFALGLCATILTCFVRCAALTYFVVTGKMVKQAVLAARLDQRYIEESQRPKATIVRVAAVGIALSLGAALLGAWANVSVQSVAEQRRTIHLLCEIGAVAGNLFAFTLFYQHIHTNGRLVQAVFHLVDERRHSPGEARAVHTDPHDR